MSIMPLASSTTFPIYDYDLAATLNSGQAFRWTEIDGCWIGMVAGHWVRLRSSPEFIEAHTASPVQTWDWLKHYLQLDTDFVTVLRHFPQDATMMAAVNACRGLRLLRQDPWECLASFIISSTKQIVQIRQIIAALCTRFGEPRPVLPGYPPAHAFPSADRIAATSEAELRGCKMGFRAPYLLETARLVAAHPEKLRLDDSPIETARQQLQLFPGVGRKIADCVLLFAYGFQTAFPIDVWIAKALRDLYFPRKRVNLSKLNAFSAQYFGPYAGFAQQYLFHYMRTRPRAGIRSNASLSNSRRDRVQAIQPE